jgi:hypothetical protein
MALKVLQQGNISVGLSALNVLCVQLPSAARTYSPLALGYVLTGLSAPLHLRCCLIVVEKHLTYSAI